MPSLRKYFFLRAPSPDVCPGEYVSPSQTVWRGVGRAHARETRQRHLAGGGRVAALRRYGVPRSLASRGRGSREVAERSAGPRRRIGFVVVLIVVVVATATTTAERTTRTTPKMKTTEAGMDHVVESRGR